MLKPVQTTDKHPESEPTRDRSQDRSHILVYLLVACLLIGVLAFFAQRRANSPIVLPATAPQPVSLEHRVLSVHDLDELKELMGQIVTVEGVVTEHGESSSGNTRYLNFSKDRDAALYFALSARNTSAAYPVSRLEKLVGKSIRVKGKVEEYKGRLQIYISKPSMILSTGEE